MTAPTLHPDERATLIEVARTSISHGLAHRRALKVDPLDFSERLRAARACFVTLKIAEQLRGCIGRLEPDGPLVCGVAHSAFAAAFKDPRFDPVTEPESRDLSIHISVLSPTKPMSFRDEADLLRQIQPGVDGLVLESGRYRGTFLPAVWESLPQPEQFLSQLKVKAGLPPDAWPEDIRVMRYTCESVH